jgi:hypothetical protein
VVDVTSHPGHDVLVLADLDGRMRGIGRDPSSQLDKNVARLELPGRVHGKAFVAFTHIEGRENRLPVKPAAQNSLTERHHVNIGNVIYFHVLISCFLLNVFVQRWLCFRENPR